MTDEQVASMLRAIEHAAETLNREGYEIPYGEPTQAALDVRFLLAHIAAMNMRSPKTTAREGREG
jgi:hypothetical protein